MTNIPQQDSLFRDLNALGNRINALERYVAKTPIAVELSTRVATTTTLPSFSLSGNTITANVVGELTVDGITLVAGDVLLIKDEADASNGVFVVTDPGTANTPFVLERSGNMANSSDLVPGMKVVVSEGTENEMTTWRLITPAPMILNSTVLEFSLEGVYISAFAKDLLACEDAAAARTLLGI